MFHSKVIAVIGNYRDKIKAQFGDRQITLIDLKQIS